jgi:hypothetical protein
VRPLVSVVVPAYDYERYLPAAIDSVLAQDYPSESLEVIVVDDGSTDGTPNVCRRYGDAIRYVRKPNGGLNSATDRGVAEARGEYLTFLDADDTWRPDRIGLLADVLQARPDVGLVYGDMEVVDADGRLVHPSFRGAYGLIPLRGRLLGPLMSKNVISAGSLMVRASLKPLFHPIGPQAAWQDWWIGVNVAGHTLVDFIDEPVNVYRLHDANMNLGADDVKLVGLLRREIPFRRWMLTGGVLAGAVEAEHVIRAHAVFERSVEIVAAREGREPAALVPVGPHDRARGAAARAAGLDSFYAGDLELAVAHLAAALANDPHDAEARAALADVGARALEASRARTALLDGVRRLPVLAWADELVEDASILTAWGRAFTAEDDATLVICSLPDVDPAPWVARLPAAVEAAGLDGPDAPDLLGVTVALEPPVQRLLAREACALLSRRAAPEGPLAGVARLAPERAAELRARLDPVAA